MLAASETPIATPAQPGAAPLIRAQALTVRFGDFHALRDVSLALGSKGVHAVIGPNGAGKSTLFNAISGFVKPTSGRVVFDDVDVTGWRADRLARRGLARSFQISATFPDLSVEDNLRMAMTRGTGGFALLRRRESALLDDEAERLLDETGLASRRRERAADLSYGRKRLLELVTTLLLRPRLLMLDEPMAGLAREDIPEVSALIARAAETRAVLLVEHNLAVVERLADEVTVLAGGRLLARGPYREVAADPRVREAYIGEAAHA
ncbi:ATP-binding cassette domain-containing protein [Bosea sp. (in: a-proteobacteria)]|uniref:ABC transporter ATP-binding protein n=1 Tax=Bosea sp. (in: a-proteobacteria) TaxID=1871050 RepID=UPI0031FF15E5